MADHLLGVENGANAAVGLRAKVRQGANRSVGSFEGFSVDHDLMVGRPGRVWGGERSNGGLAGALGIGKKQSCPSASPQST